MFIKKIHFETVADNDLHFFQSQIKENEREREQASQKKPSVRSDFIEANEPGDDLNDAGNDLSEMGTFAVGMVTRHKKYNYHCVIFGWDPVCKASKVGQYVSFY